MDMEKKENSVLTSVFEAEIQILHRHVTVLKVLRENEPAGIIRLSELTGYPQHMVRYSLRILEQEGLIEPSSQGAITTPKLNDSIPLLKNKFKDINKSLEKIVDIL